MAKVMRKGVRHTQRRDRASGVPLEILYWPFVMTILLTMFSLDSDVILTSYILNVMCFVWKDSSFFLH